MLKKLSLIAVCCVAIYGLLLSILIGLFNDNLPDIDELERFQPKRVTKVFSADGQHLRNFLEENRELLKSYDEIPKAMKDALISIEDRRFFSHWGIDLQRIFGALYANIAALDPTAEGASTLTQQLARNLYKKVGRQSGSSSIDEIIATYARKVREQITAVHIERLYTKREILTMYLNTVFFGHDAHGLKAATRLYFDKEVSELTIANCATLAGLLKAPNYYSPLANPLRATKRRNEVLRQMVRSGKLTTKDYRRINKLPVDVRRRQRAKTYGLAPYFIEHVRQQLNREYGNALYRDGLRIHTTLDSRLQSIAEKYFISETSRIQERVDKHMAQQDTNLALPDSAIVQAAFVAMNPKTGHILAMIGGRDFQESEFNRATQARRQAGSAFKPFVYTAALDNGIFPIDVYEDNAISLVDRSTGKIWDPENYDRKFLGPMTLRDGFKQSRNLIALKLAIKVGPNRIKQYARNMGITTPIRPVESIGIGTSDVHLLELVTAYGVFTNRGVLVPPVAVQQIEDADGNIVFKPSVIGKEVLRRSVAVLMTDMMQSVMDESGGTGRGARNIYGFRTAAAGKTGTTNNYADAWFIGFTPHIVAGVWVGIDNPSLSLGTLPGSRAALPLWALFMKEVYNTVDEYRKRRNNEFDYPEEAIVLLPVCIDSHGLATKYCPRQTEDMFIADGLYPELCGSHGISEGPVRKREQRF